MVLQTEGSHVAVVDILQIVGTDADNLGAGASCFALCLCCQLGTLELGRWREQQVPDATGEAVTLQENGPQPAQAAQQVSCCLASIQLLQAPILSVHYVLTAV